ncbi:MAG: glycosyltransferase family 39 protein [Fibromonadales bacterium]|nr:glycosyltransferase family 39 protein [Fibromonadales bacterium]
MNIKIKKILREPLLYLLLLSAFAMVWLIPPEFSIKDATLTISEDSERGIAIPFLENFPQGEVLNIAFDLKLKKPNISLLYNFIPDDCIDEMKVNDYVVPLPDNNGKCNFDSKGIVLDLSEYIVSGRNHIECKVRNGGGGPAGLNLNLSQKLWVKFVHLLSIALFFLTVFLILRKYKLSEKKFLLLLLVVLLLVGAFLRLYKLGIVPGGLNQDEAASLYNAYTILKWGRDYAGNLFPVHLTSFNAGQFPLVSYLAIPFVALFDVNVISVRIFPAIFNTICLFVLFLLSKRVAGERFAIVSLFLFVICPWHILLSRWVLETTILPGIVLVSVLLFILAQDKKVQFFVPCSFLCLSFYAYGAAVSFTPLFLLFYFAYAIYKKYYTLKQWLIALICCFVITLPFALFFIVNKYNLQTMTIGFITIPKLPAGFNHYTGILNFELLAWFEKIKGLLEMIFLEGKDGLPWNSVNGVHNIYSLSLPLFAYGFAKGIYDFFKNKAENLFPMLLWFLLAFATSTIISFNINRSCLVYIPIMFFAAYGLSDILKNMKGFGYTLIVLYCISFLNFNFIYYGKWATEIREHFFYSYINAAKYATENTEQDDVIYLTSSVNEPYIHVLVATKYDLQQFLETADIPDRNTANFHYVRSFGRYKFGIDEEAWRDGKAVVVKNNEAECPNNQEWDIKRFDKYTVCLRK